MTTTFSQALRKAIDAGLAAVDGELLLLAATNEHHQGRAWLRANGDVALAPIDDERFMNFCKRRLSGEPLAYITGHRGFYGLDLTVDARVLDPRPDTETLVDWALDVLTQIPHPHVVDLGTGSGAIALAIQSERRDARVVAVDASADALAVAQANADRLKLPVHCVQGSWLAALQARDTSVSSPLSAVAPLDDAHPRFDLIVSNPPYIADGDSHLPGLVHEPIEALTSGPDGLADIRLIIAQSPGHLRPASWLLLEHGYDQANAVSTLLSEHGFVNVQSRKDLAGIERCTGGQWQPAHQER